MKKVLTIAGSDCSGGAGIQADLKTMTVHKMYGMSVITALTAQNTTGVYGVMEASPEFVAQQIDCVFGDIRPDAVKIGMVSNVEIIKVIAEKLTEYGAENIVVDPVMVATSGSSLMRDDAADALMNILLPLGSVITPNVPEAEVLSGMKIAGAADMEEAARRIAAAMRDAAAGSSVAAEDHGIPAILIKGGHMTGNADDLVYIPAEDRMVWLEGRRIENSNTHGTGCTLSSAIACNLAAGFTVEESIANAKKFVAGAIEDGIDLGNGSGPLNHVYNIDIK